MKNIYKSFNDIEVDIDKINSINVELDDISKKRIKNNIRNSIKVKKNKFIPKMVGATACLIILGMTIVPQESFAAFSSNIPVLNTLFSKFQGYGGDFKDYTQVIGIAQKDKGYEVKIEEVAMDNYSFKLIYTIRCKENVRDLIKKASNPFPHTPGKSIKLNGKKFVGGAGGSDRIIDDHTVQVIEDFDIDRTNIPQKFNISIDFNEINDVKGNWQFNFNMSKEKISKDIKAFDINKEIMVDKDGGNVKLNIKRISFSPISTAALMEANGDFEFNDITFKDENGTIIQPNGSSLEVHNGKAKALYKFKSISKIPNKIFIEYKNSGKIKNCEINLTNKK